MNTFDKLLNVNNKDLKILEKLYDDVEYHLQLLSTLVTEMENYGALEKFSHEVQLVLWKIVKENTLDLAKVLVWITFEIKSSGNM